MATDRVVILGGGPGGYEAALVAAQLGAEVTVVDSDGIGGSAVLTDCVPSKTLIATAELMTEVGGAAELGVNFHDHEGAPRPRSPSTWPWSTGASCSSPRTSPPTSPAGSTRKVCRSSQAGAASTVPGGWCRRGDVRRRRGPRRDGRRAAHAARCPARRRADPHLGAGLRPRRGADRARRGRLRRDRRRVRQRLPRPRHPGDARVLARPGPARGGRRRLGRARGGLDQARDERLSPSLGWSP